MTKVRPIDADLLFLKQKSHADLFKGSAAHDDIIRRDEAMAALAEIMNAPTIESEVCPNCGAKMDLRTPTEVQLDEADDVMMGG